jgi:hypothetical protein
MILSYLIRGTIRENVEIIELRGLFGSVLHLVELKDNMINIPF